jgi:hypothetical protein
MTCIVSGGVVPSTILKIPQNASSKYPSGKIVTIFKIGSSFYLTTIGCPFSSAHLLYYPSPISLPPTRAAEYQQVKQQWLDSPRGPRHPHLWCSEIILRHITLGRTPLDERSVLETSTLQHTTLTRDRHKCRRWDSKPQSQQSSGRRPTP